MNPQTPQTKLYNHHKRAFDVFQSQEQPSYPLYGQITSNNDTVPNDINNCTSSKNSVKVYLRVKPTTSRNTGNNPLDFIDIVDEEEIVFQQKSLSLTRKEKYRFHRIFNQDSTQNQVYQQLFPFSPSSSDITCNQTLTNDSASNSIFKALTNQKKILVMAYGPSNSGKTHTLIGSTEDKGILPQFIQDTLSFIDSMRNENLKSQQEDSILTISFIEVYNEQIYDLLAEQKEDKLDSRKETAIFAFGASSYQTSMQSKRKVLDIKTNSDGQYLDGVIEKSISNLSQAVGLMKKAFKNRTEAKTAVNENSSRSHCIAQIRLLNRRRDDENDSNVYKPEEIFQVSIVDLAGSERLKDTGASGETLKEASNINKSLLTLRKCIHAQQKGVAKALIPFRESKLTRLLQNYFLSGNIHVLIHMECNGSYTDIQSTLNFAKEVSSVDQTLSILSTTKKPKRSHELMNERLILSLKQEVSELKKNLSKAESNSKLNELKAKQYELDLRRLQQTNKVDIGLWEAKIRAEVTEKMSQEHLVKESNLRKQFEDCISNLKSKLTKYNDDENVSRIEDKKLNTGAMRDACCQSEYHVVEACCQIECESISTSVQATPLSSEIFTLTDVGPSICIQESSTQTQFKEKAMMTDMFVQTVPLSPVRKQSRQKSPPATVSTRRGRSRKNIEHETQVSKTPALKMPVLNLPDLPIMTPAPNSKRNLLHSISTNLTVSDDTSEETQQKALLETPKQHPMLPPNENQTRTKVAGGQKRQLRKRKVVNPDEIEEKTQVSTGYSPAASKLR